MSDDTLTLTIDGIEYKAKPGSMLIEVADANGIEIPRFCYHKKLSVAASCRMCMVEVEKAPKPLPACATPVMDGMTVHTKSSVAKAAQQGTMEFLLINHPLDCPVCDQAGECELQDVSMEYGEDVSRFSEVKRVVKDKDIGPLISTEMTRCILCTRCVRFGDEIANMRELGATGRGEFVEVGTFIEKNVDSELSGNIIDLCPVGALTARPSRFKARAWEMIANSSIAPHDGIGSNISVHTCNGKVIRVVPVENESINETWLSDRDRFSSEGINSAERLTTPMIKENGVWVETDWQEILQHTHERISAAEKANTASLVSPNATLEEMYLLQKYLRGLGIQSIDHRLRQSDFTDQAEMPLFPWLGITIAELEKQDAVLVVGSDIRLDQPLISNRLRKASIAGGKIMALNPCDFKMNFDLAEKLTANPLNMLAALASIASEVLAKKSQTLPADLQKLAAAENKPAKDIADQLLAANEAIVLLGQLAQSSPQASCYRALASLMNQHSNIKFGFVPDAANTSGAWIAGVLPHRGAGGESVSTDYNANDVATETRSTYLLWGIEPEYDCYNPLATLRAISRADTVIVANAFVTEQMKEYADILLPISTSYETSGTFVNAEGNWQSFRAASKTPGEARPGWKVLRVLANLAEVEGFEYTSSEEVRNECQQIIEKTTKGNPDFSNNIRLLKKYPTQPKTDTPVSLQRVSTVNSYKTDALVRRSEALQKTLIAKQGDIVRLTTADAKKHGFADNETIEIMQGEQRVNAVLQLDDSVAPGCASIQMATRTSASLGPASGNIELRKT